MDGYWVEFSALYFLNLINLISPGAGCLLTVRNSMAFGKNVGIFSALGIVSSSFLHKSYVFLLFGFILSKFPSFLYVVKYVGSAYLVFLGIKSATSKGVGILDIKTDNNDKPISMASGFRMGFLTDLLNPMASAAFLGIVAATISPQTPPSLLFFYFLALIFTSLVWYLLLSLTFSKDIFQRFFIFGETWIEKVYGGMLIWCGCRLVF